MGGQSTQLLEDALSLVGPLSTVRLQLGLEVLDPLYLPRFAGNTFRGGFGRAFLSVACHHGKPDCPPCAMRQGCPYSQVFEPLAPEGAPERYREAPRPFVLAPPKGGYQVRPGDVIRLGLSIFGAGVAFLPHFLVAMERLGHMGLGPSRGKFRLGSVRAINREGELMSIYGDGQWITENAPPILTGGEMALEAAGMQCSAVRVRFTSPTRVKLGGRLAPALEFHGLVAALIHRLFPMVLCHCGASPDPASCQRLIDAARGVQQEECNLWWEQRSRRSARQGREIPMDGFVGEVTYQGNLAPFMPLLVAGTYLGVGKGTVFGNGKYQLMPA